MTAGTLPEPRHHVLAQAVLIAGADAAGPLTAKKIRIEPDDPRAEGKALRHLGVRQADGSAAPLATCNYRNRRQPILARLDVPLPDPVDHLDGLSIFGGIVGPQFGHMVTQSLGRLPVCRQFPQARLVFLAEQLGFNDLPGYFLDLVRAVGVTNPVRLISASTRCERLLLPPDLCNLHNTPCVMPEFLEWLAPSRPPAAGGPDLYVSRSALTLKHGQFLQETLLEEALSRNGYTVIHPEQLSIAEQIAHYSAAGRIVFAEGSAAHLWSLFARPDAKAAVIQRRPLNVPFAEWFASAGCPPPENLDFGLADLSRHGNGETRNVSLLDMPAVWNRLRDLGFHDDGTTVGTPRERALAWLSQLDGHDGRIPTPDFPLDARSAALIAKRQRVTLRQGC